MTILDAMIQSLGRAGGYNRDDQVAPTGILWPAREHQWEPVLPGLRGHLAHLLTLGQYDLPVRIGPGTEEVCMIDQGQRSCITPTLVEALLKAIVE